MAASRRCGVAQELRRQQLLVGGMPERHRSDNPTGRSAGRNSDLSLQLSKPRWPPSNTEMPNSLTSSTRVKVVTPCRKASPKKATTRGSIAGSSDLGDVRPQQAAQITLVGRPDLGGHAHHQR